MWIIDVNGSFLDFFGSDVGRLKFVPKNTSLDGVTVTELRNSQKGARGTVIPYLTLSKPSHVTELGIKRDDVTLRRVD